MIRTPLLALPLALALSAPAIAQETDKPANCAIYAEMTAETAKADDRITGEVQDSAVAALDAYAAAQRALVERNMEKTYQQAKMLGMDKAAVDKAMEEGKAAVRAGFHTPTMDKDKLYVDHLQAVLGCAQKAKSAEEIGGDPAALGGAIEALYAKVR